MSRSNPQTQKLLVNAVVAATTLTPRIVNATVRARHGGKGDRLELLELASHACLQLQERIVLAQLAVKRDRRGEVSNEGE